MFQDFFQVVTFWCVHQLSFVLLFDIELNNIQNIKTAGRRGRDCMVVELTTTCAKLVPSITNVVSSNPAHGEVYSIQHYVIKFVNDLRQVGGFLRVLLFPPPIKLTATI